MAKFHLLEAELAKMRNKANLSGAANEAQNLINLLEQTRDRIASATDAPTVNLELTKLQNPINTAFESILDALRPVDRSQKAYGKILNHELPFQQLPTAYDAMAAHKPLINRAIAMHFVREGLFDLSNIFLHETHTDLHMNKIPVELDEPASDLQNEDYKPQLLGENTKNMSPPHAVSLQNKFVAMHNILSHLRDRNFLPAIEWAAQHSDELEARGSNLEFELNRLQFIYLFQQGDPDAEALDTMTDEERRHNRCMAALNWARSRFGSFQARHRHEIQKLVTSTVFEPSLAESPYRHMFDSSGIQAAFDEASNSFMRDFCSLLGLSSESPLYVAITAGAIALPQLLKFTRAMKEKRTEWTTEAELAFETPLPRSMIYHPIFVCPVSKEQTTDQNPPVMLPCGHVVAQESLQRLPSKGSKVKCPYCPAEGHKSDARVINIL